MAAEFLGSHGIDLDAEMARIQSEAASPQGTGASVPQEGKVFSGFRNVCLPNTAADTRWAVTIEGGQIGQISQHSAEVSSHPSYADGKGALLAPSLCHPHVHIDKAFLLSHPKYAHLQIEKGDFQEAMALTGEAKKDFEELDLLERGQRLIDESVEAGVTHMRAFVELDAVVGMKCLDAGIKLKRETKAEGRCMVQLCAFAQLPLFTSTERDGGEKIRGLMQEAARNPDVDVLGSTPYVEADRQKMEQNVRWMVDLTGENGKHLDFHLDYHLDPEGEPMVPYVLRTLKESSWKEKAKEKTVVLGHCTRLTLFEEDELKSMKEDVLDLPISFVGLPTSDLFMMRSEQKNRPTLNIPHLIKEHGLNASTGINNIGNAFTPYGSCDPLTLACNGVGIYQAGTKEDAELLYECVSSRARQAIGLATSSSAGTTGGSLELKTGDEANLLLFGSEKEDWRTRRSISEAVYLYDHMRGRTGFLNGRPTS
ncbi:uncharacterized protein LTR77_001009 [Saxophila tyrrhenica]|uniref:Metallo-dependent hydrolase n=1 Tax=Saxophila tyrrhenica TaxID=1690608 RepID=A0AAV9PS59_9PEZI|nr:hypothetical protein LTR77_001009 [Saxophila tyrrhenica]